MYFLADFNPGLNSSQPAEILARHAERSRGHLYAALTALAGLALILIPAYFALKHSIRPSQRK